MGCEQKCGAGPKIRINQQALAVRGVIKGADPMSQKRDIHPTDEDLSVGAPDMRHPPQSHPSRKHKYAARMGHLFTWKGSLFPLPRGRRGCKRLSLIHI